MKLHHPNIPGVIRDREGSEAKAHIAGGWLKESDLKPAEVKERQALADGARVAADEASTVAPVGPESSAPAKSWTKAKLLEWASLNGVSVDESQTKAQILDQLAGSSATAGEDVPAATS